jgi:hypothetical protein
MRIEQLEMEQAPLRLLQVKEPPVDVILSHRFVAVVALRLPVQEEEC